MKEIKDIPGMPGYRVDDSGQVWSSWRTQGYAGGWAISSIWKKLKPHPNGKDDFHMKVTLSVDGKRRHLFVHYLVLLAFVGSRPTSKHEARHLNGKEWDNRRSNLAWGTKLENMHDMIKHGTQPIGERNGKTNLTTRKVKRLVRLVSNGMTREAAGLAVGVSKQVAVNVLCGRTWGHVTGIPYRPKKRSSIPSESVSR